MQRCAQVEVSAGLFHVYVFLVAMLAFLPGSRRHISADDLLSGARMKRELDIFLRGCDFGSQLTSLHHSHMQHVL